MVLLLLKPVEQSTSYPQVPSPLRAIGSIPMALLQFRPGKLLDRGARKLEQPDNCSVL